MTLDEQDRAILAALQRDATQTAAAIGGRIGLSQPATWRRIKRLRDHLGNQMVSELLIKNIARKGYVLAVEPNAIKMI